MVTIKVVCGIIYNNNKIFICRRKTGKSFAGFWEFPGGKIEQHESNTDALKRELFEELGMRVKINNFFGQSTYNDNDFVINLYGYECDLINYNGQLTDHDSSVWVSADKLKNYNLAPADVSLIEKINTKFSASRNCRHHITNQ